MFKSDEKKLQGIVYLTDATERMTSAGAPYMQMTLRDEEKAEVSAKMWNQSAQTFLFEKGSFVHCCLDVGMYNGQKNYVVTSMYPLEEGETVDMEAYFAHAPYQSEDMWNYLVKMGDSLEEPYRSLVLSIYTDKKEQLLTWSGAKKIHHSVKGGLLYHTMYVTQICSDLVRYYPTLNRSLLLAGAILHDIGKLEELDTDVTGEAEYTTRGTLLGHICIGCNIIMEYAGKMEMDRQSLDLLLHMVASHHGEKEWGAFVTPKVPEAYLLNHADMIDAKMYLCRHILEQTPEDTWTDKVFGLGTRLYKAPAAHAESSGMEDTDETKEAPSEEASEDAGTDTEVQEQPTDGQDSSAESARPEEVTPKEAASIPEDMEQAEAPTTQAQETVAEEQTSPVPDSATTASVPDTDNPAADDSGSMDAAAEEQMLSSFDLTGLPDEGMEWAGL